MIRLRYHITVLLVCLASSIGAQRPQDAANTQTLASFDRARPILDAAVAAHGGEQRLRAIEDLSIRYRGRRWMAYQSPSLARPWNVQRTESDLVMDLKNGRMMRRGVSRYPIDFAFEGKTVLTPQGNFFYDPSRAGKGDVLTRFRGGPPVASHPARREFPAFMLLNARDRAQTVRYVGETNVDGARAHAISYAEGDGSVYTLLIDDGSKRLVRVESLRDDPVIGDQVVALSFPAWRDEKGVQVPTRVIERRNEEIIRDDTVMVSIDTRPADSIFAAPASGYTEVTDGQQPAGPDTEAIRKLAENVYLLQQLPGGNKVMFVAFRDYVLVFEAPTPQNAATAVMDAVRRTVSGKPIRYVTFSHHHDDHGGGLRPYISEGITIVTTPSNRRMIEEIAVAKHTIRPDALSASPKQPVIETYTRKRVFTDGDMTVELHDIGPTSHVDEIALAYLPREKLVFQGDLIILPDRGEVARANMLTQEFLQAIDRLKLDVRTVAGVHGRVGTIDDLRRAVQLRDERRK
jgi:glyoxylase-like metal-dependent hydrolase (beta-lactamase superfamily II)